MQRSFLMTQKVPQRYDKTYLTKIHPKHHVIFLGPWRHKTCFLKRGKVVRLQPKNTGHQIVNETVWIVN